MLGTTLNPRQFLDRVAAELGRDRPRRGAEARRPHPRALRQRAVRVRHRQRRQRLERLPLLRGHGQGHARAAKFFDDDTKKRLQDPQPDRQHARTSSPGATTRASTASSSSSSRTWPSPGDLLVAISGSGNSPNILRAVEWANTHGLTTFGCTGFSGGKLRGLAHHSLHVPLDDMGIVESIHLTAFHWVVDDLHRRIDADADKAAGIGSASDQSSGR